MRKAQPKTETGTECRVGGKRRAMPLQKSLAKAKRIHEETGVFASVERVKAKLQKIQLPGPTPVVQAVVAPATPNCPNCAAPMCKRTNGKTGQPFWGCSTYPKCRGYRSCESGPRQGQLIKNPSVQQKAVFDWIQHGAGHGVIEAVAGSGKTSTMVHAASLFPNPTDSVFLAFNKHIADELANRLPGGVACGTMHSLCLRAIKTATPGVVVDGSKLRTIVKGLIQQDSSLPLKGRVEIINVLCKLASLAKSTLVDASDRDTVLRMAAQYGITTTDNDHLLAAVERLCTVLYTCAEDRGTVDYDDMIWHVVIHDLPIQTYGWVVVDEAQDLNNLQIDVLHRMISRNGGRCIAVGDRFQSIYGFRGANTQAIPELIKALSATTLPLTVCYRCPTQHIELAQRLVPQIEAREGAPAGVVSRYTIDEAKEKLTDGDLVVCRINSPLVGVCLDLIRRGRKATIKGRDIGKSLISLIESMNARTVDELRESIGEYKEREMARLFDKGEDTAAQRVDDECSVIEVISSRPGVKTPFDVTAFITSLFQDDSQDGVICSSVHKAKGLEANVVFILRPELMPSRYAKTGEEKQQERNLEYVALTRSKRFLGFITK